MSDVEEKACNDFQEHPHRNQCCECRHPKSDHPLDKSDMGRIKELLVSLAKDSRSPEPKSDATYAWLPPDCPKDRVDEYFKKFPPEHVPKYTSDGMKGVMRLLMQQIPMTDVEESESRFVEDECVPDYEDFIEDLRRNSVHFGYVKVWKPGMPLQCPTCLILLEDEELVVVPTSVSATAFHPHCFVCCVCRKTLADLVHCFDVDGALYCVKHYSETIRKRCHACDELIFSLRFAQADGVCYHREHLRCYHCDELLQSNQGFERSGEIYCSHCFEEEFASDCEKCGKRISLDSKHVTYEEKFWHYNCFTCDQCGEVIADFEKQDDKFYCVKCYTEAFAPKCNGCKQVFEPSTKVVKYDNKTFHVDCFKCGDCQDVIGTGVFVPHGDRVYCKGCHLRNFGVRCFKCHYAITDDKGVMYNKQPYHADCFTCSRCQTQLSGHPFKNVDDNLLCVGCYGEEYCSKCHSCGEPILLGEKDVLYSYQDFKWHSDCFECHSCNKSLADTSFAIRGSNLICKGCISSKDTKSAGGEEENASTDSDTSSKEKKTKEERKNKKENQNSKKPNELSQKENE